MIRSPESLINVQHRHIQRPTQPRLAAPDPPPAALAGNQEPQLPGWQPQRLRGSKRAGLSPILGTWVLESIFSILPSGPVVTVSRVRARGPQLAPAVALCSLRRVCEDLHCTLPAQEGAQGRGRGPFIHTSKHKVPGSPKCPASAGSMDPQLPDQPHPLRPLSGGPGQSGIS